MRSPPHAPGRVNNRWSREQNGGPFGIVIFLCPLRRSADAGHVVPDISLPYSLSMADSEPGSELAHRELRASHDDRDRVVEMLRVSAGDGRLTAEELDERLELAMTARTYGELAALVSDLPESGSVASAPGTPPRAKDVVRIDCRSSHVRRDGPWVVPQRMEVKVTSGQVTLDFSRATITQPTLRIDMEVKSGHVLLVTRPGIVVDTDDVAVSSGHVRVRTTPDAEVPVQLRIEVAGKVGSGHFLARPARPPRRSFWDWLTRQPRPQAITAR